VAKLVTDRITAEWDRHGDSRPDPEDAGIGRRWLTEDGRWLAFTRYGDASARQAPTLFAIMDEPATRRFRERDPGMLALMREWGLAPMPTPEEASEEMRLLEPPAPPPEPEGVEGDSAAAVRSAMRDLARALRTLVFAQEAYFSEHMRYATAPSALRLDLVRGASVEIVEASDRGWSARATHAVAPDRSCVVHVGDAALLVTLRGRPVARDAEPRCDDHER
jgi:hypothetical protein